MSLTQRDCERLAARLSDSLSAAETAKKRNERNGCRDAFYFSRGEVAAYTAAVVMLRRAIDAARATS